MEKIVNVIGAGLAGVEACHQLVKRGYKVRLYEMRPKKMTPAHHSGNFAELVCSNSLRADGTGNAVGVLKAEMEMMDSLMGCTLQGLQQGILIKQQETEKRSMV